MGVEDIISGDGESVIINIRRVEERAIECGAQGLVFVHNHPSGDPTPSPSDEGLTRDLVFMGMILRIRVLDHIIIGENSYYSFAGEGLIKKYEDSFLNLKIKSTFAIMGGHFRRTLKPYALVV
jgi:DNA repair protein RadC